MTRRLRPARHVTVCAIAVTLARGLLLPASGATQSSRSGPSVEVHEATIRDLQTAMERGRVTSVQLVDAHLARIAAYDGNGPELNAMIVLNPRARAEAAALDQERRSGQVRGPLHGIPIVVKDNYDTAELPTTGGSIALAGARPADDAFILRKLRAAGAVLLGKTNLHELAYGITTLSSLGGQTRNPYDPMHCAGGSSGGTAAAIAASFAVVGWGTDTCGSIRIPAAYNSLFGLRPTQGLVSRGGLIPMSPTQDIAGPLARSVTDLAIALEFTVGADSADLDTRVLQGRDVPRFTDSLKADALRGARLGVLTYYFRDADGDVESAVRAAIRTMEANGAEVVDVPVPGLDSLLMGSGMIASEMKFALDDYLARIPNAPVRSMEEIVNRGLYQAELENRLRARVGVQERSGDAHRAALAKRAALRSRLLAIFDSLRLDALVYPTMRQRPAIIGEPQLGNNCALSANSGFPALSAPAGFTRDGLPVGIELLGRPFSDARLVAMAYAFEQSGPRRRPPPTTPPLVNGRAPRPRAFTVVAQASPAVARVDFTFDPLRNELGWNLRITGVVAPRVQAAVLQRVDTAGAARVIHRLSGPGATRATGRLSLRGVDRQALLDGRLQISLFTQDRRSTARDGRLALPP